RGVGLDGREPCRARAKEVGRQPRTGADLEHVVTEVGDGGEPREEVGLQHLRPLRAREELEVPLVHRPAISGRISWAADSYASEKTSKPAPANPRRSCEAGSFATLSKYCSIVLKCPCSSPVRRKSWALSCMWSSTRTWISFSR